MKNSRNLVAVVAVVACCLIFVWLSTSIQGSQKTYELKPQIAVPEYRTDAARAIDAYERLMDRYMDLTERNLFRVGTDIEEVARKLDSIDNRLTQLSTRIAGIEKALGIEQPNPPVVKRPALKPLIESPSAPARD
jgi:hypothetical protein